MECLVDIHGNVEMLSFLDGENIGGGDMNDIWGWVDPEDGTECIIGRTNGTAFIDVSPLALYIANLPTATSSSMGEIKDTTTMHL